MRVLVVQLLRMGDIVMSTPILRSIKDRWPEAEVELLINSSFQGLTPMLGKLVDQVHLFEYGLIQSGLGESDRPILESYWRVQELVEELNQREFDLILNLTHNRLSGWLVGIIEGGQREGISLDEAHNPSIFGLNSWFRYINENLSSSEPALFHWIDAFLGATRCGNDLGSRERSLGERESIRIELEETACGVEEVRGRLGEIFLDSLNPTKWIVVQPFTSDPKKSWDKFKFTKVMEVYSQLEPQARFVLIGAPSEKESLTELCTLLRERSVWADLLICSLEGALALLKRADLLLTCDTGIKHMASATDIKIVEISVGSSQVDKTGTYSPHAILIQSGQPCTPCSHSVTCPYEKFHCHEFAPELVAMVMHHHLMGNEIGLQTVAEEYKEQVKIYRSSLMPGGFWALRPFCRNVDWVGQWILQWAQAAALNQEHSGGEFSEVGSLALTFVREMTKRGILRFLRLWMQLKSKRREKILHAADRGLVRFDHELREWMRSQGLAETHFTFCRRYTSMVDSARTLIRIELKIINSLRDILEGFHVEESLESLGSATARRSDGEASVEHS